jgi:hypothetical protein
MTAMELATYHLPEDPASSAPARGIHRGMCGVLQVRIRCAITPISPLSTIVLWSGVASLDPFRDLAHGYLRELV